MKKGFLYTIILLLGVGIGFGVNALLHLGSPEKETVKVEKVIVEKIKSKTITDTLIIKESIFVPVPEDSLLNEAENTESDTLNIAEADDDANSLNDELDLENEPETPPSAEGDEVDIIVKDELIAKRTLKLDPLPVDSSDVSELLEVNTNEFSDRILVEFWQSPLNITGYELSRNKLKLFGFNPSETIKLKLNPTGDRLLLNTETMGVVLEKKNQFQTLNLR